MAELKSKGARANKAYQVIQVEDMTAGLDLRSSPSRLAPDRATKLMNWSVGEPGALAVRPGYQQFSTDSLGSRRISGGRRVYLSSHTFSLVAFDGRIYQPTDSGAWGTGSSSAVFSTISSGNVVQFPFDRDLVAVFDATNTMRKSTNGSSWTLFGIERPPTTAVLSSVAGSSAFLASKEYEINYTYEDTNLSHESNATSQASTFTTGVSTGEQIRVKVVGSTDPQVDKINIYARNVTDGETVRRKASSLANPAAGSTDSVVITSTDWLSNAEEPSDHNMPEVFSIGVAWKNRWWARDANVENRLYFSQIFQPQSWPATFFIDIPFGSGDSIQALVPLGDLLIVFGHTDIFLIFGQTSLDFEVRPAVDAQDGILGAEAVDVIENGVIHAGASGIYIFDGVSDRLLSHDIEPGWRDLIQQGTPADVNLTAVEYHALRKEVRIAVPRLFPTANYGEWILDLNRTRRDETPAWVQTDRTIGGYIHWDGNEGAIGNRGRLQSWHSSLGLIFDESTGTTANSSNLIAEYTGPTLTVGMHRARLIDTFGQYEPNDGTFSIETEVDGLSQGVKTIAIGSGLATYGTAVYGTATYGSLGRRRYYVPLPVGAEGRSFTRKMKYTGQAAFKTYTYGYGLRPETRPIEFSE